MVLEFGRSSKICVPLIKKAYLMNAKFKSKYLCVNSKNAVTNYEKNSKLFIPTKALTMKV